MSGLPPDADHVEPVDPGAEGDDADEVADEPLGEGEAAIGAAAAETALDETLDERVETVLEDLDGVIRRRDGGVVLLAVGSRVFAVLGADFLEVALEPAIATAALRTADTRPSPRGAGWIAFTPRSADQFALDRAEAWVKLAHRRAFG